jgi:hypothetical protein
MENKQSIDHVEEWLKAENRPIEDQNIFMGFTVSCGKTPAQIIGESKNLPQKQFADQYGDYLLKYTALQQKSLPANTVRAHTEVVRAFFKFHKLPLKFGVKAHIQFFLK